MVEERLKEELELERYKREVQIAPLRIFVPDLYDRIFDPDYVPQDEDSISATASSWTMPKTDEEFEEMYEGWADLGGDGLDLSGVFTTPDLGELGLA